MLARRLLGLVPALGLACGGPSGDADAGGPAGADAGTDAAPAGLTFALITDVHVGEGYGAYGGEEDDVTARARAAVARVNARAAVERIDYVFVLGDLTDSAETAEFARAREILDGLAVPWIALLGNHDVWPYSATFEDSAPTGDAVFAGFFGDRYAGLPHAEESVWNPAGFFSRFQNFELRRDGIVLLGLDWSSREHAVPGYKGVNPEADLHDFPGGTVRWLEERLADLPPGTRRVFFLQHHPFRTPFPLPTWAATFTSDEGRRFRDALAAAAPVELFGGVFAGHVHRSWRGPAFDEWATFAQVETDACKETAAVTLVRVGPDGTAEVGDLL